jgi:hypothetical protein
MSVLAQPVIQLVDVNGHPLALAKAKFSQTGSTTPVAVYQDNGFVTPHTDPVVANAQGIFPPIYLTPALGEVRCRIIPADGDFAAPLVDVDPCSGLFGLGGITNAYLANMNSGTVKANLTGAPAPPANVTLTALTLALDHATEADAGVTKFASVAEAVAGLVADKAVTPAGVKAAVTAIIAPVGQSIAANGYVTFSNGLIVQWGRVGPINIDNFIDIVFPLAFPAAAFAFLHSPSISGAYDLHSDSYSIRQGALGLAGVRVYCASSANAQAISVDWIAIGH